MSRGGRELNDIMPSGHVASDYCELNPLALLPVCLSLAEVSERRPRWIKEATAAIPSV